MKTTINNRRNRIDNEVAPRLQSISSTKDEKDLIVQNAIKILEERFINNESSPGFLSSTIGSRRVKNLLNKCLEESVSQLGLFNHINKIPSKIGFFYIISNRNFPNYYKVGHSKDAETRLNHYQTYSPFRDFVLERYLVVSDSKLAESAVLAYFSSSLANEWLYSTDIAKDFSTMAKIISNVTGLPNRWAKDNFPEELLKHFIYMRDKKQAARVAK